MTIAGAYWKTQWPGHCKSLGFDVKVNVRLAYPWEQLEPETLITATFVHGSNKGSLSMGSILK